MMPWPKERYPCEKCSRQVHAASAAFLYPAALANKLCPNCYGAEFKIVDDLWATVDEQHEALDEGNEEAGPAVAILRKACLDFLKETEPTNQPEECHECGGMGHTIGFLGKTKRRYPCESC